MADTLEIACHCGNASQTITLTPSGSPSSTDIAICHCATCRHATGQLFASYLPLPPPVSPAPASLARLRDWTGSSGRGKRYFCPECGCHVFLLRDDGVWSVATGTITSEPDWLSARYAQHEHVSDTLDGGLAPFLRSIDGRDIPSDTPIPDLKHPPPPSNTIPADDTLLATCACTSVSLLITRPDPTSHLPHSPFPDLLLPYHSTPQAELSNPSDTKWWLCPPWNSTTGQPTRYLAGTCACRTCRLTAGFEIQSWSFIPASNIHIRISDGNASSPSSSRPENTSYAGPIQPEFRPLQEYLSSRPQADKPLRSYTSTPSSSITRDFCANCGATVFWRGRSSASASAPAIIDVSAGLFGSGDGDGARASPWLAWGSARPPYASGRVSFVEDAGLERRGAARERALGLVGALETGFGKGCG